MLTLRSFITHFRVMRPYGLSLRAWILVLISIGVSISIAAWLARTTNYSHIGYIGSVMTKAHHDAQDLPVADRILEFQTVEHFLSFLEGSQLPNGTQPTAAHITAEELSLLEGPCPLISTGESILDRVASRIGSEEDSSRLTIVGKNIQSMKTRLWEGIHPMSEERWVEKQLSKPDNFDLACQHLSAVVAVFQYLNEATVRCHLRDTFNLIHNEWTVASDMLNNLRDKSGLPRVDLAALWTLYMTTHYKVMTERVHRWVIDHVKELRAPIMAALKDHVPLGEENGDRLGEPDAAQWKFTNQLHELLEIAANADYTILMPMDGYNGYVPTQTEQSGSKGLFALDWRQRGEAYGEMLKLSSRKTVMQLMMEDMMTKGDLKTRQETSGEEFYRLVRAQVKAQDQIREDMRSASADPLLQEPWVNELNAAQFDQEAEGEGREICLAVYRLTYEQTDEEWSEFVKMFEEHSQNWGLGLEGSDQLKRFLKFEWIDGRKAGIPEGDLEGAKKKHNELLGLAKDEEDQECLKMQNIILAIDAASYASYTTDIYRPTSRRLNHGDFTGFVVAVDLEFNTDLGLERPDESPGYTGEMRVLGNLVWCDLFAQMVSQSVGLKDLWPLAFDHPNQVYIGPTVPLEVAAWRETKRRAVHSAREGYGGY